MHIWDFNIDYDSIAISFYCDKLLFSEYVGREFVKVRDERDRRGVGEIKVRYIDFIEDFPVITFSVDGKRFELKIIEMVIKKEAEDVYHYWIKVFYEPKLFDRERIIKKESE